MKFSNAALCALVASATFAASAPTEVPEFGSDVIVTRQDANEILDLIAQIENIHSKRELLEDGEEYAALTARADSLIGQLVSALANSGIIGQIWTTLTTDPQISSIIGNLIQTAIKEAIVQGPALILAIWNSGLISNVWNTIINDTDLQSAFFNLAKSLFSSAANILLNFGSGGANTAAPAPAATGAAKREFSIADAKRQINGLDNDILDKRDLASLITAIVNAIANSGIVTSLVNYVLANPQQSISLLESALSTGVVVFEDVYSWAKSSGILQQGLNWIAQNGGAIVTQLGTWLANALASGTISPSQINNAQGSFSTTTPSSGKREVPSILLAKRMLY